MDSGFQVSTGFQFLSLELEFRIPIVSGIPDSLSSILYSKAQDFGSAGYIFPDSGLHKIKRVQIPESGFPYVGRINTS